MASSPDNKPFGTRGGSIIYKAVFSPNNDQVSIGDTRATALPVESGAPKTKPEGIDVSPTAESGKQRKMRFSGVVRLPSTDSQNQNSTVIVIHTPDREIAAYFATQEQLRKLTDLKSFSCHPVKVTSVDYSDGQTKKYAILSIFLVCVFFVVLPLFLFSMYEYSHHLNPFKAH